jgi:predicted butyrate kinase (DUF1464 family)
VDLIAGPSGYGLPLARAADVSSDELRLAYLSAPGERGGLGGWGALARALAGSGLPVVLTPGVIHLPTVPDHRKVNRVDLGTADKVCATALAIAEESTHHGIAVTDVSLILVELGGAFTAAVAVEGGQIVDGIGGTSGPIGLRSAGALDGEVAFLVGSVEKSLLFTGGVMRVRGDADADPVPDSLSHPASARARLAWDAYLEGIAKAVAALRVSVPHPDAIVVSGRVASLDGVVAAIAERLGGGTDSATPVRRLDGFARVAKHAAQGAALLADGLAGGGHASLVDTLAIRRARGTVLDHLYVISPAAARRRLGLA